MTSNPTSRLSSSSTSTSSSIALLSSSGRELLLDLKRSSAVPASSSSSSSLHQVPVLPSYNTKLVQSCFRDLYGSIQALDIQVQALSNRERHRKEWHQQQQRQEQRQQKTIQQRDDGPADHNDNNEKDSSNNNDLPSESEEDVGTDPKPSMGARPSILLLNASIQRYKRCLLAYHYHRMNILKDIQRMQPPPVGGDPATSNDGIGIGATPQTGLRGGGGGTISTSAVTNNAGTGNVIISTNAQEVTFAQGYAALRAAYSTEVFDLGLLPPTSHMVQVKVMREVGRVVLPDSGRPVTLTRGACLFVDRADVQDFLLQGVVQIYDGEEIDF